jgi:hypothetical protein
MNFKNFLKEFLEYSLDNLKKIILYFVLILVILFLVIYNSYRLSYSVDASWSLGIFTTVISSIIAIFLLDLLSFLYKIYR